MNWIILFVGLQNILDGNCLIGFDDDLNSNEHLIYHDHQIFSIRIHLLHFFEMFASMHITMVSECVRARLL